jgi:hypothetical protein
MSKKTQPHTITRMDILILFVSAAATVFAAVYACKSSTGQAQLVIQSPGNEYVYDLSKDRIIEIKGTLGISRIAIEHGTARFLDSPCRQKICVQHPPISKKGEWAACLPNRVFIKIEAEDKNGPDITAF